MLFGTFSHNAHLTVCTMGPVVQRERPAVINVNVCRGRVPWVVGRAALGLVCNRRGRRGKSRVFLTYSSSRVYVKEVHYDEKGSS